MPTHNVYKRELHAYHNICMALSDKRIWTYVFVGAFQENACLNMFKTLLLLRVRFNDTQLTTADA